LHEELDVPPTAKTTALYELMLHNRFDPGQWPAHRSNGLPQCLSEGPAGGSPVDQALDRLRRLEAVTEETRTELRDVRQLIEQALAWQDRQQ
jgi:hypothetical protein